MSPTLIAGYLALFVGFGFLFLFVHLLLGRFLRPKKPSAEKLEVYECGEPAIGTSFVQFDLRFYVVALLFIIFDVEVSLFFPWAAVYGKTTQLMDPAVTGPAQVRVAQEVGALSPPVVAEFAQLGVPASAMPAPQDAAAIPETARTLALMTIMDVLVFFAVLMVGFAYVWRRGDLDWVRALSLERQQQIAPARTIVAEDEPALAS